MGRIYELTPKKLEDNHLLLRYDDIDNGYYVRRHLYFSLSSETRRYPLAVSDMEVYKREFTPIGIVYLPFIPLLPVAVAADTVKFTLKYGLMGVLVIVTAPVWIPFYIFCYAKGCTMPG